MRRPAAARASPSPSAQAVGYVRERTSFGSREVVLVLERATTSAGEEWLHVRLPIRPNGSTGWLRRADLGDLRVVRRALLLDTEWLEGRLLRDGEEVWSGPLGVGSARWPTPVGRFYVRMRFVPSRSTPLYGAYGFCTSGFALRAPWQGGIHLAIHGTNRPELIPGRVSAGCIRMRDEDALRLRELLPLGTPVTIR
jgi:hypothetical protein